ncbi:hypothetical protein OEZ86_001843 [Tetradesmus obliquus]|nr:hypothetical protein OEZ86_001843 [Tetradesmus obliquus]
MSGDETDWTFMEEKILRDVSRWLSPADLRRARLVCKSWLAALATLSTKATTPPEAASVTKWRGQLEAMVLALPCLQELTIGSKLSSVGAQQLGVLASAHQLRCLHIPYGQALQDRSLQALHPMATTLKELRIRGAASLSQRALLLLSVLGNLETLELKNCGKVSWAELQEAWRTACMGYEAQAADAATPAASSSMASRIGGWLPGGGRLFRTSSPCSSSIHSAVLAKQKSGGGGLLALLTRKSQAGSGAAVAGVQLGSGAVGNGRSSSGGGSQESEVTLKNPAGELAALASLTSLTSLEMGKCKLPDSVLWRLTSLKRLRKLKLSGLWSMGNDGIAELAKLTMLKSLALSEAMHATAAGLLVLSQLTGLTGLSLGLTQDLGPGAVARVVASLPGLQCAENIHAGEAISQDLLPPQLTSLSLRGLPFGNVFNGCVNMPACSSSMAKLELSSLSGIHCGQLRRVLSFFPKLRDLSLAGNVDIEDAAMAHLQLLPQLTALNLSGSRVSSAGVEQLAHLPELRVLFLKGCSQLTDAGLQQLAALPALQELDVSDCGGVSEQGLRAVMQSVPALVQLDVCGCKGMSPELVHCCPHYLHLKHSL